MIVLFINKVYGWVQITTGDRRYNCPTNEIDGELYFKFKKQWHKVDDYVRAEFTDLLIEENGRIIQRKYIEG